MKAVANKFNEGPVDKSKCNHTPGADELDYRKYSKWAADMRSTHNQTQCMNCGFWHVWVKK